MINNQTNNSLLILLWNCNGILNHTNELIAILHEKRIDIALIAESHLTVNSRLYNPGYQVISSNHPYGNDYKSHPPLNSRCLLSPKTQHNS